MIHEVRSTDAEVEDVDLLQDGIVECVQEPWCVRHLHEQKHDNGLYLLLYLRAFASCALCLFLWTYEGIASAAEKYQKGCSKIK